MSLYNEFPSSASAAPRRSRPWEIYIPFSAAAVPAGIFALLGFVTNGLDKPEASPPFWLLVLMVCLQLAGMIAMAVVILTRMDVASKQLSEYTHGRPPAWRRFALLLSIGCLLLFDILTNISVAFAGAGPLLVAAIPAFLAYFFCGRIALAGLRRDPPEHHPAAEQMES
jgi:hypothetical protein